MFPLDIQLYMFSVTVLAGVAIGALYDVYRLGRRTIRLGSVSGGLADLAFWVAATAVVSLALLYGNWGELRLYVFVGLTVGLLLYYRLASAFVLRVLLGGFRLVHGAIRRIVGIVLFPIRVLRGRKG